MIWVAMLQAVEKGCYNLSGQQNAGGDILGDFACHVVTLNRIDGRILVGVLLLYLFVVALDEGKDPVIGGIGLTGEGTDVTVGNIFLGNFKSTVGHDGLFHQVLNFFHRGAAAHFFTGNGYTLGDPLDLQRGHTNSFFHGLIGLGDSHHNFVNVKNNFCAVALNNLHSVSSLGLQNL